MNDAILDETLAARAGTVLAMRRISKSYGPATVLKDIDFDVREGEIHALMGENGAGKSTLIKVLTGVVRMDDGEIEVGGQSASIRSIPDARACGIAVVHQELSVLPNLTVEENLFLAREEARGFVLERRRMREESVRLLERLGLSIDPDTPVEQLDVAERQAIEICRALAEDARILVLDEPTAALSESERESFFAVIERLRDEGLGIVYVSHHLGEISRLADRVTVLRNGAVVLVAPMDRLTENEVVEAMLGEPVSALFPDRVGEAGDVVLEASGLKFGRRVRGVDVELRRGEILGISGLVGSGHRELGRMLSGRSAPTGGSFEIAPGITRRLVPGDRKTEGLMLDRPGSENLSMYMLPEVSARPGWLHFLSRRREREFSSERAARLRLRGDVFGPVESLSGGNQQKILVGRTLDSGADVIVLEEPTRGVDVGARSDLYELIAAEARAGAAIVVVSTDLREVAGLCDRVLVLDNGSVAKELAGEQLTESAVYRAAHADLGSDAKESLVKQQQGRSWLRTTVSDEAFVPWAAFVVLVLLATFGSSVFSSPENLQNLTRQSVTVGFVGLGQLLVVLAGHVDLSIGSIVGLTNLISAEMSMSGTPLWMIALTVVGLGALIGLVNATLVRLGIPALLVTFAMASVLRGIIVWMFPQSVGPVPQEIWALDRAEILGLPTVFLVLVLIIAIVGWVLRRTPFGRHLYATGGDFRAASLSGVRTWGVVSAVFVASGVFAALAGLHLTARAGAGLPNAGTNLEFEALAVVMIGGASLMGGRGTIRGMIAGLGIVLVLANIMNLMGFDAFVQNPIKGAIIVLVAVLWAVRERSRRQRTILGLSWQQR